MRTPRPAMHDSTRMRQVRRTAGHWFSEKVSGPADSLTSRQALTHTGGKETPMQAPRILKKGPPIAYLLECSDSELGNFELARLADVANLRKELHAALDRVIDAQSLALLAARLRTIDRQELKRELLKSPDARIKEILAGAKEEIRNQGHSEDEAGPMPSPWLVRPRLPAEVAQA